ncbi:MAG: nuclear transport factor 2 family protein [Sphingomonas sp.]|uniref:nuclear transport factor 2 family protein n=1 Tax=Sphingomonas sp. TaxID=28214 RepID=UPI0025F81581|nr:nuclear transport factor 2 family protein [Sphingomonas sp.]MBX9882697.1 nuclear transport factor 2 family protein [Sphingomonas sp.]
MEDVAMSDLSAEHANFYERFKSFWAAPSGERVLEIIAPDAVIHFTGAGHMSGRDYAAWMGEALARFEGLAVTPMDSAGNRDMLYIAWEASADMHGERRTYRGVDRFRLRDGMAIEEHVIFDSAVLTPAGRVGIDKGSAG